jgi:hypothetical protein
MEQYIIFNLQSDFDSLNSFLNQNFGYPNKFGTLTYAIPIINGQMIAILIEDRCVSFLSIQQQQSLVTIDKMDPSWFVSPNSNSVVVTPQSNQIQGIK